MSKKCCHHIGSYIGFQCCTDIDADNPVPYVLPNKDRNCTDLLWLSLLLAMIVAQGLVIRYTQNQGADTRWLFHGVDINGTVCDETYPSDPPKAYTMWPYPLLYDIMLCTDSCNHTQTDARMVSTYRSELVLDAWCLPLESSVISEFDAEWDSVSNSLNRATADVVVSQSMLYASVFVALLFCFAYLGYIGSCGGIVIWLTIILSIFGGAAIGYALISQSAEVLAMGWHVTGNIMKYTGWTLSTITALFALGIVFMRSRIQLAIKVIKEAAKALESIPLIVFFPFLCSVLALAYFAFWCVGALHVYSVAVFRTYELPDNLAFGVINLQEKLGQTHYVVDEFDKEMREILWVHIFGLFWVFQFIVYFCYAVMAHVFSGWYFAAADDADADGGGGDGKKVRGSEINEFPRHPILHGVWTILRYHLGTVAFGAFIVAVVKFINAVLTYLQSKAAKKNNPIATAIFACVKCCLKCLECCLDILSKHGLVFTAIYGTTFCHSCSNAFRMFFNNLARVAAVTAISKYLEFLGKMAITILTTGICVLVMQQFPFFAENLSSLFFPALIIIIISYGVASIFMVVFEVAIDTIFLCFLIDEQCHINGSKYATHGIKNVIDEHQKESIEAAHHLKSKTMAHRFDREELVEMHERGVTYEEDRMAEKQARRGSQKRKQRDFVAYVPEAKSSHHGHVDSDELHDV